MSPIKRIPFTIKKEAIIESAIATVDTSVTEKKLQERFRFLSYAEIFRKEYDEGRMFLVENEYKEPAYITIDYIPGDTLATDEWIFIMKRSERFSVYSQFQWDIGSQLGKEWDRELHGWKYPAVTYNINRIMQEIESQKKNYERWKDVQDSMYQEVYKYYSNVSFTPLAKQMLEIKQMQEDRWEKLHEANDSNIQLHDFSVVPFMNHQVNGIEFMTSHDSICGDSPGTGKTRQGLNVAWKLYTDENTGVRRAIVVCPATIKRVWYNQAREYMKDRMIPIVVDGNWEERLELLSTFTPLPMKDEDGNEFVPMPLYIINYEKARSHPVELQVLCNSGLLILDEAHKIKSMSSQVTKVIRELKPIRKIELTGTLIMNTPNDAYPLVDFVRPGVVGRSYHEFFNYFCYREGYRIKYRNLKEFNERIRPFFIRRTKEVLTDLPEKTFLRDYEDIELGEQQRKKYREMALQYMTEIESLDETQNKIVYANNVMVRILRLLQICDGFLQPKEGGKPEWIVDAIKPKIIREILEEQMNNGHKVVVWSRFLPPLEMLESDLAEYHPVVLHGGVPEKLRGSGPLDTDKDKTIVGRFWTDPKVKILLGQIQTGGQGIDLSCADKCIFYDQWWGPGANEQAEDRLHRKGQKNPVTVIPLVTGNTIETYYFAYEFEVGGDTQKGLLYQKKDWNTIVVDGRESFVPSKAQVLNWIKRTI